MPEMKPRSPLGEDLTVPLIVIFEGVWSGTSVWAKAYAKTLHPRFTHVSVLAGPIVVSLPSSGRTQFIPVATYLASRPPGAHLVTSLASSLDVGEAMRLVERWSLSKVGSLWAGFVDQTHVPRNCATMVSTFLTRCGYPVYGLTPDQLWSKIVEKQQADARRERGVHRVAQGAGDPGNLPFLLHDR